jgi:hypothetical protein
MNRHERRRAEAKTRHNKFVADYVRHLPEVSPDTPLEPGRVFHAVFYHDDWCKIYDGDGCNCRPDFRLFAEPKRT